MGAALIALLILASSLDVSDSWASALDSSDADVCVLASHPMSAAATTNESATAMMIASLRRLIIYLLPSPEVLLPHVAFCSSELPFRSPPSLTCLNLSTEHDHRGFYEQLPFLAPVGQDQIRVPIAEHKITDAGFDLWKMCTHHVGESSRSVVQIELALCLNGFARSLSWTSR